MSTMSEIEKVPMNTSFFCDIVVPPNYVQTMSELCPLSHTVRYLYYLYYVQLCPKNYAFSLLNRYFVICIGHSLFGGKNHPF